MNNNEGLASLFGLFILLLVFWLPFFYSGISLLYLRDTKISGGTALVECRYLNATGLEWPSRYFSSAPQAENYYCPRWKWVGVSLP